MALRDRLSRVCLGRVTAGDSEISAKMGWEWFCCTHHLCLTWWAQSLAGREGWSGQHLRH